VTLRCDVSLYDTTCLCFWHNGRLTEVHALWQSDCWLVCGLHCYCCSKRRRTRPAALWRVETRHKSVDTARNHADRPDNAHVIYLRCRIIAGLLVQRRLKSTRARVCGVRALCMECRRSIHEKAVRPSVCPSNAWIVTKRKHLAKKINYDEQEVAYEVSNEPNMISVRRPWTPKWGSRTKSAHWYTRHRHSTVSQYRISSHNITACVHVS